MSLRYKAFATIAATAFLSAGTASMAMADSATLEDAEAFANAAYDHIQDVGSTAALDSFNDPDGPFVEGDLYVFAIDYDGYTVAHGANHALVDHNHLDLLAPDGTPFQRDMLEMALNGERGFVDYEWIHPVSGQAETKRTYVIPAEDYFIGVGAYIN